MNKRLLELALRGLTHLGKPAPVDLLANVGSLGVIRGAELGVPIHPQTAHAINRHFPDTFDDDDVAVFETTFFSKHL